MEKKKCPIRGSRASTWLGRQLHSLTEQGLKMGIAGKLWVTVPAFAFSCGARG